MSTFIIGFAINEASVKPNPAKTIVSIPFSKTRPDAIEEAKYSETVSIVKCLSILFTA